MNKQTNAYVVQYVQFFDTESDYNETISVFITLDESTAKEYIIKFNRIRKLALEHYGKLRIESLLKMNSINKSKECLHKCMFIIERFNKISYIDVVKIMKLEIR